MVGDDDDDVHFRSGYPVDSDAVMVVVMMMMMMMMVMMIVMMMMVVMIMMMQELSSAELQICAVCVEEYKVNDKIRILPCRWVVMKPMMMMVMVVIMMMVVMMVMMMTKLRCYLAGG